MAETLWTDDDVRMVVEAIYGPADHPAPLPGVNALGGRLENKAVAVLEAMTAAGWRPHAIESTIEQANQTRANTAEQIAQALEARRPHIPPPMATDRRQRLVQRSMLNAAARIAREAGGRRA